MGLDRNKYGKRFDTPRPIEELSQPERIKRLHHQLSVIYDRVFLTGDWKGDHLNAPEDEGVYENIFGDKPIDSPRQLADSIDDFLTRSADTVPDVEGEDKSWNREKIKDKNREIFSELLDYVYIILTETARDTRTQSELAMEKCIDENIHHFRDAPIIVYDMAIQNVEADIAKDDDKYTEGLQKIYNRLQTIAREEGMLTRDSDAA